MSPRHQPATADAPGPDTARHNCPFDLVESQAYVLHHADEDEAAERFGLVPALPCPGQVGLYEAALNTMALAPVRPAFAALPVMRRQEHGRSVTIASIGGKLSVPHLLPYSTAKFAAVGFSEGLRAELGRGL